MFDPFLFRLELESVGADGTTIANSKIARLPCVKARGRPANPQTGAQYRLPPISSRGPAEVARRRPRASEGQLSHATQAVIGSTTLRVL